MFRKKAFTMLELVIALAVVAIIVAATIPLAKSKMDKVDKFSYYLAYAAAQDIAANIVAQNDYDYEASDLANASDLFAERLAMSSIAFKHLSLSVAPAIVDDDCDTSANPDCMHGGGGGWGTCPGNKQLNGICITDYIYDGYSCGWDTGTGLGQTYTSYKISDGCDGLSVSDGYKYDCLWGGSQTVGNTEGTYPSVTQPSNGQGTAYYNDNHYENSYHWYCFKYKKECNGFHEHLDEVTNMCVCDTGYKRETNGACTKPTEEPITCSEEEYYDKSNKVCKPCNNIKTWSFYKKYAESGECPLGRDICARFSKIYSEKQGTCIDPSTAQSLCEQIKTEYNISKSSCDTTAATMRTNTASSFKGVDPHIKLSNGLNIYIASDLVKIDAIDDSTDVRDRVGYLIYVDSNGNKGKGILYEDVFPFYILITGKVLPLYNPSGIGGANDVENLTCNVLYDSYDASGNRAVKASQTGVDYRTAACATKYIDSAKYCGSISVDSHCADSNADCRFVVNKPMKFSGR